MSGPRVDLADPCAEGALVFERLRREGYAVERVGIGRVPYSNADVVLLAGDLDDSLQILKRLRDDEVRDGVPVLLLGVPPNARGEGRGPAFGADAVFERPIELDALVERVQQLRLTHRSAPPSMSVIVPPLERTMQLPDDDDARSAVIALSGDNGSRVSPAGWRPREPTMQLDDVVPFLEPPGTQPSGAFAHDDESSQPAAMVEPKSYGTGPEYQTGSRPGTGPLPMTDGQAETIAPEERAVLSPWLEALLASADRRVFPERAPLKLYFPRAAEPPEVLVPDDLFEAGPAGFDEPLVDDPIDAFTFVGGPVVPPASVSSSELTDTSRASSTPGRQGGEVRPEASLSSEPEEEDSRPGSGVHRALLHPPDVDETAPPEWPAQDSVLGSPTDERDRRGALGEGGVLRLLSRIAQLRLHAVCRIKAGDLAVRLTFLGGELRAFEGGVMQRIAAGLARRGRTSEVPVDEPAAEAALGRWIREGVLGSYERDRLAREAREELLRELIDRPEGEFVLTPVEDTSPGRALVTARVLGRPLTAVLVQAAGDALTRERVEGLLGAAGLAQSAIAYGPRSDAALRGAELPPELTALLGRMQGRSFADVLAEAPGERGLPGMLYALVAADALLVTPLEGEVSGPPPSRASVTALVESAASLAEEGDYFAILGLSRDAGQADVSRAYAARRDELLGLPLELLGLYGLGGRRREALEALEEARDVLVVPGLRRAYAEAIGR